MKLLGFCDASENVYTSIVYLWMTNFDGTVQVALVMSKTKVTPIKQLNIPQLELCGAYIVSSGPIMPSCKESVRSTTS